MTEPDFEVGRERLLDESNTTNSYGTVYVTCADPDCTLTPSLGYIAKNRECLCGHPMAVKTLSAEVEE